MIIILLTACYQFQETTFRFTCLVGTYECVTVYILYTALGESHEKACENHRKIYGSI